MWKLLFFTVYWSFWFISECFQLKFLHNAPFKELYLDNAERNFFTCVLAELKLERGMKLLLTCTVTDARWVKIHTVNSRKHVHVHMLTRRDGVGQVMDWAWSWDTLFPVRSVTRPPTLQLSCRLWRSCRLAHVQQVLSIVSYSAARGKELQAESSNLSIAEVSGLSLNTHH